MKLTKENVDKIFRECEWSFDEWRKNKNLSVGEAPHGAFMLAPLPSKVNVATFHPDKLKQYEQEIGELLDQVACLSQETGITLRMLGFTVEGTVWSEDIYVIQKLYLLGVATDQLNSNQKVKPATIYRIPKEKSIVSLVAAKEEKGRFIGKILSQQFFFNNKK